MMQYLLDSAWSILLAYLALESSLIHPAKIVQPGLQVVGNLVHLIYVILHKLDQVCQEGQHTGLVSVLADKTGKQESH